jgi:hypothetical protein
MFLCSCLVQECCIRKLLLKINSKFMHVYVVVGNNYEVYMKAACLVQLFSDQLFRESRCGENLAV